MEDKKEMIKEDGQVKEKDTPLSLDKRIETQLTSILASGDRVAAILSPPEYEDEMTAIKAQLMEKSPAYKAAIEEVPITVDTQEGLSTPIVLGLSHLTVSFLHERFAPFINWMQSDLARSMGMGNIPIIPTIDELRVLFLLDSWLIWRSREASKKPSPLWSPGTTATL